MAWKEGDRVSERAEFLKLAQVEGCVFSTLCRRFGISRKTGYKWRERGQESGDLRDRSRRPKCSPRKTADAVEQSVLSLRTEHPTWGGRKLRKRLLDLGLESVPSASTITAILHRHELISPTESQKRGAYTRFERSVPNELWQMDFKGEFAISSRKKCYPLTILDDHSRYSLGIRACNNQRRETVERQLRRVFDRYGIPHTMYVDNGPPWGNSCRTSRHTRFSVWLMRNDIEVIHGRPYHPQGRGKLERFHRTLKQEVIQERQFGSMSRAQSCFDDWRPVYNHERPHEGLNDETPGSLYRVSDRSFRKHAKPYSYSSRFQTRKANRGGEIKFNGKSYRLSEVFIDEQVGLCPTPADGVWDIYYCRFVVGQLDERTGRIRRTSRLAEFRYAPSSQAAGKVNS